MNYRREIDGLRAIAVIPVILFHAGFRTFSGGFVGVDVFFVISGYLISTIILSDKERGTFSLVDFYERRTRRILPALFLVMLVSLPFAWLWLLPSDMQAFSQSLIAVATFSSNLFFWRTSGYWGADNELVPLLHTWSLAVEEQYYLLFPLFLMLMWRFRKRWIFGSFMVIAAASLLLAEFGAHHYPTATFFLLVTRGWELAIGAGIAFYFLYRKRTMRSLLAHRSVDDALSLVGLLMIGYAVLAFDETVPFPSVYALVPTLGTGLIIVFSSPHTLVGRLLGTKLLVGIGLVSYSAYLWHVPLLAFARYRSLTGPGATLLFGLAMLSILLAVLSWRFVEQPFRRRGRFDRKTVFTLAAAGSACFIGFGIAGQVSNGWPARTDPALYAAIEAARLQKPGAALCLPDDGGTAGVHDACTLTKGNDKFAFLLGDSHAIAASSAMQAVFEPTGIGLVQAAERGCPPVLDVYVYVSESDRLRCFEHNQAVYRYLAQTPRIEYVILVARWALYVEGVRFENTEGGVEREETLYFASAGDDPDNHDPERDRAAEFGQAYADSIARLLAMGKKVILVYPIPEAGWHVPRYVRNYFLSDPADAFRSTTGSTSYEVFQRRNRQASDALDRIGDHPSLVRVYPERIFCNDDVPNRCIVQKDGALLYGDDDHLSAAGATLLANAVVARLP